MIAANETSEVRSSIVRLKPSAAREKFNPKPGMIGVCCRYCDSSKLEACRPMQSSSELASLE